MVDSLTKAAIQHCVVTENGTKIVVPISGISYDDFDRHGNISIWKIAQYFTTLRVFGHHHPDFYVQQTHGGEFHNNYMTMIIQCDLVIERSFYTKTSDRRIWFATELSMELVAFENSSLFVLCQMHDSTDDELLMTMKSRIIVVDKSTRKRANHDESFCQKFSHYRQPHNKLPNYEILAVPKELKEAFKSSFVIRASDTDDYEHTQNGAYIQLCMDGATIASVKHRHFTKFSGDVGRRLIKSMKVFYSKECYWGDVVDVYVWEDISKEETLFFQIHSNGKALFHMFLEYYPEEVTRSKI